MTKQLLPLLAKGAVAVLWGLAGFAHGQVPQLNMAVVTAPQFPSGTSLPNGGSYAVTVQLRNDGSPSPFNSLANVYSVYATATQGMGILIPYAYNFEIENNNTNKSDAALYVRSYQLDYTPYTNSVFPTGVVHTWNLDTTGLVDMYKCFSMPINTVLPKPACDGGGYPGAKISYRVLFRVYDTQCAQNYNPGTLPIVDRRCIIYEKKLTDLNKLWVENDPTDGQSVAQNPNVPTYPIGPSPIPAFQATPNVGAFCNGNLASEVRNALAGLGFSYPGQSYCQ
ncbi:MAG: hypothetical protein WAQ08_10900 [Aquabacterium sp.]|uniref:hypothetical protein n=1 Tax=Aquabacterium sp. TaxID=1872578 RepID=UPI003BAF4A83